VDEVVIKPSIVESKTEAPVDVEAVLDGQKASVVVRVKTPVTDLHVQVFGSEGVVLLEDVDTRLLTVSVGELSPFEVQAKAGMANGLVTVVVEGLFNDRRRGKTIAFEMGTRILSEDDHRLINGAREKDHRIGP
jgi:hypothetical protein